MDNVGPTSNRNHDVNECKISSCLVRLKWFHTQMHMHLSTKTMTEQAHIPYLEVHCLHGGWNPRLILRIVISVRLADLVCSILGAGA
jgi:hypothetical protein